jgi:hypothetical protein
MAACDYGRVFVPVYVGHRRIPAFQDPGAAPRGAAILSGILFLLQSFSLQVSNNVYEFIVYKTAINVPKL